MQVFSRTVCRLMSGGLLLALAAAEPPALAEPLRLMAYGDSLTHGYGLPDGETFP